MPPPNRYKSHSCPRPRDGRYSHTSRLNTMTLRRLFFAKDDLPEVTSLSVSTIEEEIRQGRFPKPRQLAGRRVGWLVREIEEWAESRPVSDLPPPRNTGVRHAG